MAKVRVGTLVRWLLIIGVFTILTMAFTNQARAVRTSDGVLALSARASIAHIDVTVTNLSAEPLAAEGCSYHAYLTGGIQQPPEMPCSERNAFLIGPGQSVTHRIPVQQWLWGKQVEAHLTYQAADGQHTLSASLPRTWLFWSAKW